MNRLAAISQPPRAGLWIVLDHLEDAHPDDATTVRMWLSARIGNEYTYAHQDIADALTDYCKANNLGTGISEASVRRYRKARR